MDQIKNLFDSIETGVPFRQCICCKVPLVEIDAPWLVNKEFFRGECVLEYAICQLCRDGVSSRLSEESKESVRKFLEHEIDWEVRLKEFMLYHDLAERFVACISCRALQADLEGFSLCALFDSGGKITEGPLPLLICRPCVVNMTASLSEESRMIWRDFIAECLEGPPSDSGFPGIF
jgi:hypothetical protein